jgi:Zn finger protein HypA/HybF involved in hydrogenase expression
VFLPKECPNYWETVYSFSCRGKPSENGLNVEEVRLLVENMQVLNEKAFATDKVLIEELCSMSCGEKAPLGVVLVPPQTTCRSCGGKLLLRSDRPSRVTIYTESEGTLLGSHYHKFCQNYRKGCSFTQYYGYCTTGEKSVTTYEKDCDQLPYFISTSQTAFETELLKKFDVELLIGELSYQQKSNIYNYFNGYDNTVKQCSSVKRSVPR